MNTYISTPQQQKNISMIGLKKCIYFNYILYIDYNRNLQNYVINSKNEKSEQKLPKIK